MISKIIYSQAPYENMTRKINATILITRKKKGIIKESIIQEYIALSQLRNAIVHYAPEIEGIFCYPKKLLSSLRLSKVKPVQGADWVETFKTKTVLDWAKNTIVNIINSFLALQGKSKSDFYGQQS